MPGELAVEGGRYRRAARLPGMLSRLSRLWPVRGVMPICMCIWSILCAFLAYFPMSSNCPESSVLDRTLLYKQKRATRMKMNGRKLPIQFSHNRWKALLLFVPLTSARQIPVGQIPTSSVKEEESVALNERNHVFRNGNGRTGALTYHSYSSYSLGIDPEREFVRRHKYGIQELLV